MGYSEYDVRVPCAASDGELRERVAKKANLKEFSFRILKKSLDARKKNDIFWQYRVGVSSEELPAGEAPKVPTLRPEFRKRDRRAVVVGSGPAGYFSARWLALSGFTVTLLERGSRVEKRREALADFEGGGRFPGDNNYSFGEGGAGTFSDGKLSSRTKGIDAERNYIYETFVEAGAPEEIRYMTHPHLGSDNLFKMTLAMRSSLETLGCTVMFDTTATDLTVQNGMVTGVVTPAGSIEADIAIFACGHSAFETYRMLMRRGVAFANKNFAIGFRAEHLQKTINQAQWGVPSIPGVKAAEYRLAAQAKDGTGVYSFCMCPGGKVVPAAAYAGTNVVNGMSNYARDGKYANAAIVAGVNLERLVDPAITAERSLEWLENLERSFYNMTKGYKAPAMTIRQFIGGKRDLGLPLSSYPLGVEEADLRSTLPPSVITALNDGLYSFSKTLRGFDEGLLLGLESKTSAPVQAKRHPDSLYCSYPNLFICGEGAGWSGGIVSSAADGLRTAIRIAETI